MSYTSIVVHARAGVEAVELDLRASSADLDRLRRVLVRTARRIRSTSDRITPSQRSVLATVYRVGPVTVGQVAEIEHIQPPAASRILTSLEQLGLVERRQDPADRRCSPVVVTQAGTDLVVELSAAGSGWLAEQLAQLSNDDVERIAAAVPALERLLDAAASSMLPAVQRS